MKITNFLIVDDHSLSGKGAASELRLAFPDVEIEVRKTINGPDGALAYLASMSDPCVVLTDLRFDTEGSEAGMDLLEYIKGRHQAALPIVLSAETDISIIKRCIALGAKAYLTKGDSENMCEIVERVVGGGTYYPGQSETKQSDFWRAYESLQPKQRPVFDLVVAGKSKQEIALALKKSEGHIKNSMSFFYSTFLVAGRAQLIALCHENGYVPARKH